MTVYDVYFKVSNDYILTKINKKMSLRTQTIEKREILLIIFVISHEGR